jgi:hypothetical protein
MYPYMFVAGPNKHDVLFVSRVPADCEILTQGTAKRVLRKEMFTDRFTEYQCPYIVRVSKQLHWVCLIFHFGRLSLPSKSGTGPPYLQRRLTDLLSEYTLCCTRLLRC